MRVKKDRATMKKCKGCAYKKGVKCCQIFQVDFKHKKDCNGFFSKTMFINKRDRNNWIKFNKVKHITRIIQREKMNVFIGEKLSHQRTLEEAVNEFLEI